MSMAATVHLFTNGMVAVFDEAGEQMPDYQGRLVDVEAKIRRDLPDAEWKEPFDYAAGWPAAQSKRASPVPEHLFVGGPLHSRCLAVPDGLTVYRHAEPPEPVPGDSWPPRMAVREFVYWRREYVHDGQRGAAFSLDGAGDSDLLAALVGREAK